ncbi:protein kinase domain-containing protein [Fictibacillus gelatini]|uniref:class III lanthionine synthetase LanKC N-terminal domain-containing protein n=1 Tax=Fictibacillus gelatini TaxID=225985 RepID=UPI000405A23C|nr:protein kinase [Fictibacillus gelatini]
MNPHLLYDQLEKKWKGLCKQYLPLHHENSIWRQNRLITPEEPDQGWKLHLSATVLSACHLFEKVAPFLSDLGVLFKAPHSMLELKRLNSGLYYGFNQVGKFLTIYPRTDQEAVWLANELHIMTNSFPGPAVPYDIPFIEGSRVHYRYGAFRNMEMEDIDGNLIPALRTPEGQFVPDLRGPGAAVPSWVKNPFQKEPKENLRRPLSPLQTMTLVYEAISQRGKGGVYRALDLSVSPARLCILKEGRKYGETEFDNRDGYWRVKHETEVLQSLAYNSVNVPQVYTTFEEGGNYYLAMEEVEGTNLQSLLDEKLPTEKALNYSIQLAKLLDDIHSAGWVWRDCKPMNVIVTKDHYLRPIDFEGACPVESPDSLEWGTQGYVPPEYGRPFDGKSQLPEDLYALGATMHQLFSGQMPKAPPLEPIEKLNPAIPSLAGEIIAGLLSADPHSRPSAHTVFRRLETITSTSAPNKEDYF